jgi:hypothetical protein
VAKITPQTKQVSLQVAAVIASGLAERGVLPTDKSMRNVCLTALRLTTTMDQITSVVEKNGELLTMPLEEAHAAVHGMVAKAVAADEATPEAESKAAEPKA